MAKILKGGFYKLGRGDFENYFERIFQLLRWRNAGTL